MDICFNDEYRYIKLCVLGKKNIFNIFQFEVIVKCIEKKNVIQFIYLIGIMIINCRFLNIFDVYLI